MDALEHTLEEIRTKAGELRDSFGDDARARALEWAAERLERALRDRAEEQLTLTEAARRTGYSPDHISRLIREGKVPNVGRRGSPRVRAADLPARQPVVTDRPVLYDPVADARALGSRR